MRSANIVTVASSALALTQFAAGSALAQATDWTHNYVGVHLGWDSTDFDFTGPFSGSTLSCDDDGLIGGLLAGTNFYQNGAFVAGAVTDISFLGAECGRAESQTTGPFPAGFSGSFNVTEVRSIEAELDWKATLRARAGFELGPSILVMATGGIAFAHAEVNVLSTVTPGPCIGFCAPPVPPGSQSFQSNSEIHVGGVFGGEIDWRPDPNSNSVVSLQIHHYEFDDENYGPGLNLDLSETVVRGAWTLPLN